MPHLPTIPLVVALLLLANWQLPLFAQQSLDDEFPMGVPDLLVYSDDGAALRDGVGSTLGSTPCSAQQGIVFDVDVTQFYLESNR